MLEVVCLLTFTIVEMWWCTTMETWNS